MGIDGTEEEGGGMNATTDHDAPPDDTGGPLPPADPRPDPGPQPPPPVRWLRRATDSPLGGVATGLANYFGITPLILQVVFVALTAFSGFGVLAYIACWFLIPSPSDPETRPVTITSDTSRAILGVLFAIGAASTTLTLGPNTFEITLLPLILIAAGVYLLNQREIDRRLPAPAAAPAASAVAETPTQTMAVPASPTAHWADIDVGPPPVPEPPSPPVTAVTLAVAAVVIGVLLTINQFGASIPAVAVIGAAIAVVGGGLIYGAFRGRARGLVPVGLLLMLGLVVAPAIDAFSEGGTGTREYAPTSQAEVLDAYDLGAGPLELDLRRVEFTEDQTITVDVGAGYAEIWLPSDVNVDVNADVTAGYVELFGRENAGVLAEGSASQSGRPDLPTLTLDLEVTFGYVEVRRG